MDPLLVAGVTLLQFMEKAPDRQAIQQLRMHLGWKLALGLAVDEAIVSDLGGGERLEQQQDQHGLGRADTK